MSTEPQRICSICGNELSGAMEFCPVCMLRKGLASGVESGESSFEEAVKPTPEQATQRFEHYEPVKGEDGKPVELGRGAMGVTYKAFDVDLRCPVALKVISERSLGDESARLRFLREARAAARLRHSNVASVLHLGRTESSYFYAMEFVEGETLENLIKRSGHVEVKLALEIATQVAAGLAAVHKQKLVHRDIKPVGRLRLQMNFSMRLSLGLEIQIHGSERRGRRAKDWRSSAPIVEPYWFWMAWSRSKIHLVHKKGAYVSLPYRRFCAK